MRAALVFLVMSITFLIGAQEGQDDSQDKPAPSKFEVASLKRNLGTPAGRMTFQASPGGRFTAENMPLRLLMQRAYGVRPFQISGGPGWIDSDRFDITAKADGPALESQIIGPMLQALLEERFRLILHRETKEIAVLNLTQVAGGKFAASKSADCANVEPAPLPPGGSPMPCHEVVLSLSPDGARLRGEQANTSQLVVTLANILGRPVIDRTSNPGWFDLDLEVSMDGLEGVLSLLGLPNRTDQAPDNPKPSIFTALTERVGLKLVAGKGPVEVLVIEHVERPAVN
jgi:uncharacterized protein (TIGR03435 family)